MADWARLFHDIACVKKRILQGELPLKWRNLSESAKEELTQKLAKVVKDLAADSQSLMIGEDTHYMHTDADLSKNWSNIVDLKKYGIFT